VYHRENTTITLIARSKAWTVFLVSSNPTRGMNICIMCVYSVLYCAEVEVLEWADPPSKQSCQLCIGTRNWRCGRGPTKGCRAIIVIIINNRKDMCRIPFRCITGRKKRRCEIVSSSVTCILLVFSPDFHEVQRKFVNFIHTSFATINSYLQQCSVRNIFIKHRYSTLLLYNISFSFFHSMTMWIYFG
jgi:hypothetical protein